MLRAVIWKRDDDVRKGKKQLDTGHDLRQLLERVRDLRLIPSLAPRNREADDLEVEVQRIARLWFNNMRFASTKYVETRWFDLAEVTRRRTMKQATEGFYYACERVLRRCEVLCQR